MLGAGCGALFLCATIAHSDEPALVASARRALQEAAPQIAIEKLHTYLRTKDLPAAEVDSAALLLAEALSANGEPDEALAAIEPLAARNNNATARYSKALIFAAAGRWQEALPLFQEAAAHAPTLNAKLGWAESLQGLGRTVDAVEVLEKTSQEHPRNVAVQLRLTGLYIDLQRMKKARAAINSVRPIDPQDVKWKQYLSGRFALADGQPAAALAIFDTILHDPHGASEGLLAGATLGDGEARAQVRDYDAADRPLENFIWRHPDSPWLESIFTRLDQIYAQQKTPTEGELQKWAIKQPPRCAALARFYVARMQIREKRSDKAAISLSVFIEHYPTHPLVATAHLMQADLLIEKGDGDGAVRTLDAAERAVHDDTQRAEIELRRGLLLFQQRQYLLAINEFERAATHSPKLRESAMFDGALAALNQQNYDRFLIEYRKLTESSTDTALRSDLILEEGFTQARHGDLQAEETLELFLNHFPLATRQSEARLALAELDFQAGKNAEASEYLRVVNTTPTTPDTEEHAEYLAVFLAETQVPVKPEHVIEQALGFIRKYPKSALLPEVRMKLGQVYFQAGNFAGAETQFATLAHESPTSDYAETALFLAGQAAMQSISSGAVDRALGLFDEVVKRDGPLKLYARQQQAIVQAKLGKENEAITLYDAILSAQPAPDAELRYASLAGKGENLLMLGRRDKHLLEAALIVFDQLASTADVPPAWRNQAFYKKAGALTMLDRQPEALTALYDVLDQNGAAPREYFWYYKAGFDLAALFEQQNNWKSAIGIYEKMAKLEGPRAADATARAKDLRLKHFIWE